MMPKYCCEVEPENMPDLVAVVRCKDCKKEAFCRRHWDKDENWFCADGKRKEGDK